MPFSKTPRNKQADDTAALAATLAGSDTASVGGISVTSRDTAAKRAKVGGERHTSKQIIPIKIDQTFWNTWRDDPAAMKAAGATA